MRRLVLLLALLFGAAPATSSAALGPLAPTNPFTAPTGTATMHGDTASSDVSPFAGPDLATAKVTVTTLGAACPAILQGDDGIPVALCTAIADQRPVVELLDPGTGRAVASLKLPKGNLFGGVYTYLDEKNRLVLFDGNANLIRVAHRGGKLSIDSSIPAVSAIDAECADLCGGVVGLTPDWRGRVWFATAKGLAGFVDPASKRVATVRLGDDEQVANSISSAPGGTAIATDHALYLLSAAHTGDPRIVWRAAYDRGPARKPGQLSHGTGATPTFFGPDDGARYLLVTDNASPAEHLLVYDTRARARVPKRSKRRGAKVAKVVCDIPVLTPGPSGTENSPIGIGRSVFVASTYGYPYPASPSGAEPTDPASAPFAGGLTRIDLRPDGSGCDVRWQTSLRSAAVPRFDRATNRIYTAERTSPHGASATSALDVFATVAVDADSGEVVGRTTIGTGAALDTLQLAPTIVPGRVLYQGTISGITRIG